MPRKKPEALQHGTSVFTVHLPKDVKNRLTAQAKINGLTLLELLDVLFSVGFDGYSPLFAETPERANNRAIRTLVK